MGQANNDYNAVLGVSLKDLRHAPTNDKSYESKYLDEALCLGRWSAT